MTFREVIVVCSVNQVEISELNVETFRTLNRVVYVTAGHNIKIDVIFRHALAFFCNAPNMNRIATATFLPGYNFPCVFSIQSPRNTRRKFHNILFLEFSVSVTPPVCIYIYLTLSLYISGDCTPPMHISREITSCPSYMPPYTL